MPPSKTIPRFFVESGCIDVSAGRARVEETAQVHQMRHVLRLDKDDTVHLLDGLGGLFEARVAECGRSFIDFCIDASRGNETITKQGPIQLTVCLPLIKPQRFELALEKLCELGADTIIPFQSKRCVVKGGGKSDGGKSDGGKSDGGKSTGGKSDGGKSESDSSRTRRWHAICREASEQCERLVLPQLSAPVCLEDLLEHKGLCTENTEKESGNQLLLLLSERNDKAPDMVSTLYNRIGELGAAGGRLQVIVLAGPEGGFTDDELQAIEKSGFAPVSLGRLVLRSETACLAAAALISALNTKEC